MTPYKFAAAAALLATVRSVAAVGSTTITNQCSYPVYLWSVAESAGMMHTLSSNGGSYSETYRTNGDGGGISIKMSNQDTLYGSAITQFEYTLDGMIWYDVSNINGYPFEKGGLKVTPSESSCPSVACTAGVGLCSAVYNQPHDDHATGACADTADLAMVLCPGGSSDSDASPAPVQAAPADPAPAPADPAPAPATTTTAAPKPSKKKPAPKPETTTEAAPAPSKKKKPAPAPAPTTTQEDPVIPVVTTMVTQVVTAPVNAAEAAPTSSIDKDWWIGHYPASWASFPEPSNALNRRVAEPTAHAHHHHHARHAHHGHHFRR